MLKKSLGLLTGLLVSLAVFAAGAQLRADHPDTYVVKKGDTLWSISARFLQQPWLWPEIWRANPQVENPHLIYPGDVLSLAYDGLAGADGASPYLKVEPRVRAEDVDPTPPIPLDDLKAFLKDLKVVDAETLEAAPYVVAFEEEHLRGSPGQFAYVRGLDAEPGERYAVVRPTHAFRMFREKNEDKRDTVGHRVDSNVAMFRRPWKEFTAGDGHWGKGKSLGVEAEVIGEVQVQRGGDPATTIVSFSQKALRAGDRLLPIDPHPYDATYYPHAPASVPAKMRVIALANDSAMVSTSQIVALSAGAAEGIDNGATFSLYNPGRRVHDNVASPYDRGMLSKKVTLPEEYVGHVLVFRTFEHVSYGLIMDGIRPVTLGAVARQPE